MDLVDKNHLSCLYMQTSLAPLDCKVPIIYAQEGAPFDYNKVRLLIVGMSKCLTAEGGRCYLAKLNDDENHLTHFSTTFLMLLRLV